MNRCPNCEQLIEGESAYITETGIRHCGCYWACDPMANVTCVNDPEIRSDASEEEDVHVK